MQSQFLNPEEVEELVQRLSQTQSPTHTSVKDVAEVTGLSDAQVAQELDKMRLEKRIHQLESDLQTAQEQIKAQNQAPPMQAFHHGDRFWGRYSRYGEFGRPIRLLIIFVGIAILTLANGFSHLLSNLFH